MAYMIGSSDVQLDKPVQKALLAAVNAVKIGDVVRIRGKPSTYRERIEIKVLIRRTRKHVHFAGTLILCCILLSVLYSFSL